jgi:hypothetical protein
MDAMLKQQVAFNTGSLVAWVQQKPQQQLLQLAVPGQHGSGTVHTVLTIAAGETTASLWAAGVQFLEQCALVASLQPSESAGVCSLAERLTQQLEQSGTACSRNCNALRDGSAAVATRHACTCNISNRASARV